MEDAVWNFLDRRVFCSSVCVQHINEEAVLGAVSFEKDVDGFHPINVGTLCMQGRKPLFVSCTPRGCIELLVRSGVQMKGKRAVVIGRSNIVGTPAAQLLQVLPNSLITFLTSCSKVFPKFPCFLYFPTSALTDS
jgi:5,10-methylene-tetrahydrofolate dehydrogenase/methenyl tetrahydrofolate cyclohydrolase